VISSSTLSGASILENESGDTAGKRIRADLFIPLANLYFSFSVVV
jgi:hypothetical protein